MPAVPGEPGLPSVAPVRVRLFVALELPEPVRRSLTRWRAAALDGIGGVRPLAPESLHATLCFLGWRSEEEIEPIAEACDVVRGMPAPELELGEAVWLPRRRPRVLAVELSDPDRALARAQATVSAALAAGGWYEPERRPYYAHVSVARVVRGGRVRPTELPAPSGRRFHATRVVLYRSRLERGGARYEPLATVELAG